jgi:hypothetical protein
LVKQSQNNIHCSSHQISAETADRAHGLQGIHIGTADQLQRGQSVFSSYFLQNPLLKWRTRQKSFGVKGPVGQGNRAGNFIPDG